MGKGVQWHNTQFCDLRSTRATRRGRWKPTIHHKFHIPCSRCFHSCGRNLLTDICCRNQYLRNRYTIIFYENYLNFSVHIWIFIHHFLNGMDQPYDLFCPGISRCCFRRKNKCDRCCNICWIFFDLLIYINDMQTF